MTGQQSDQADPHSDLIVVKRDGAVAHVAINRPAKFNALNIELSRCLTRELLKLEFDADVRAIALTGNGRAFVAGADVQEFQGPVPSRLRAIAEVNDTFHELIRTIGRIDPPVIAGIHGAVAGGGVGVVLAADLVVAAEGTKLVPAYLKLGATPDAGTTWHTVRLMGRKRAYEWFMTGRPMEMSEALDLGLVNRVVPPEMLKAEVESLARMASDGPAVANGNLKKLLLSAGSLDFEAQLDAERRSFLQCAKGEEFEAGITAFFSKKPVRFR